MTLTHACEKLFFRRAFRQFSAGILLVENGNLNPYRSHPKNSKPPLAASPLRVCYLAQPDGSDEPYVLSINQKSPESNLRALFKRMAATYSRGSYTTTTIGHAVFDGRVRNGNGSDHCGNATKLLSTLQRAKFIKKNTVTLQCNSLKTTHRSLSATTTRELKFAILNNRKAIKPHDQLVLVS